MHVCVHSVVSDFFVTPWTIVHQATLSMGFSRQEDWSWLLFPSPGDHPDWGTKTVFFVSPALAGRFFTLVPPGKPQGFIYIYIIYIYNIYIHIYEASNL